MSVRRNNYYTVSVFLLLYYCYLNALRKFFIPFDSVTIPALLILVLVISFFSGNGRLWMRSVTDIVLCCSWLLIAAYVLINNYSLSTSLISGGMIQLYVLIAFLLFASSTDGGWTQRWVKWTRVYVFIHAIATIVFYFNSGLFHQFAQMVFSGQELEDVLRYYRKGYMTGLSGHFSTNGLILSAGVFFYFEEFMCVRRTLHQDARRPKLAFNLLAMLMILYALILSSKRSPLLASIFAVCFTVIVYKRKNVVKRLLLLVAVSTLLAAAYIVLVNVVPGLSTIADKFYTLEESNAGLLNGRLGLWDIALSMFRKKPIFGYGFGSYRAYTMNAEVFTTSAHNYYLQILAELGIVGLALYITAFISAVLLIGKRLLKESSNPDANAKTIMVLCIALEIQIYVLIYNITATGLMYYYILIPYFIACSVPRAIKEKGARTV